MNRVGTKRNLEFRENITHTGTAVGVISIPRVFMAPGLGESM